MWNTGRRLSPPRASGRRCKGRRFGSSGVTDMPPPGWTSPLSSGCTSMPSRTPSIQSSLPQTGRPLAPRIIVRYACISTGKHSPAYVPHLPQSESPLESTCAKARRSCACLANAREARPSLGIVAGFSRGEGRCPRVFKLTPRDRSPRPGLTHHAMVSVGLARYSPREATSRRHRRALRAVAHACPAASGGDP